MKNKTLVASAAILTVAIGSTLFLRVVLKKMDSLNIDLSSDSVLRSVFNMKD